MRYDYGGFVALKPGGCHLGGCVQVFSSEWVARCSVLMLSYVYTIWRIVCLYEGPFVRSSILTRMHLPHQTRTITSARPVRLPMARALPPRPGMINLSHTMRLSHLHILIHDFSLLTSVSTNSSTPPSPSPQKPSSRPSDPDSQTTHETSSSQTPRLPSPPNPDSYSPPL